MQITFCAPKADNRKLANIKIGTQVKVAYYKTAPILSYFSLGTITSIEGNLCNLLVQLPNNNSNCVEQSEIDLDLTITKNYNKTTEEIYPVKLPLNYIWAAN